FAVPASLNTLVNQFRRDNSDPFAFMQDCLVVEKNLNPGNLVGVRLWDNPVFISSGVLEDRYNNWCYAQHIDKPNFKWLVRNLKTILPKLQEKREMYKGSRERVYYGIGANGED